MPNDIGLSPPRAPTTAQRQAAALAIDNSGLRKLKSDLKRCLARATWERTAMAAPPAVTVNTTLPTAPYAALPAGTIDAVADYLPYVAFCGGWPIRSSSSVYAPCATRTIDAATGGTSTDAYVIANTNVFNCDADVFSFRIQTNPISRFWIKIDGKYVTLAGHVAGTTAVHYVHIDWTGVAGEGDPHLYEIEMQGAADASTSLASAPLFGPFYITALDRIWAPSEDDLGPQMAVLGDSLTVGPVGGQVTVANEHRGFAQVLGDGMGLRNVWSSGVPGSGWIARASGQNFPDLLNRIGDATAWDHKVAIIADGINDNSLAGTTVAGVVINTTNVQARVTATLTAIRAAEPLLPIVVFGPWWRTANSATAQSYEDAISAGVAAMADPRIAFIPTIATALLSGSGSVQSPNAGGNADRYISDLDGQKTHWNEAGHRNIAQQMQPKILAAIEAMY